MDEQQVKQELARILNSEGFRSRKQMCNFLSYIVNETLGGRGRYLKQYTIAVYGLGKPEDFSPGESPLVRVEAGRLRGLLDDYYQEEGKGSSVRIILPKGSYQPEFSENSIPVGGVDRRKKERRSSGVTKAFSDSLKVVLGFKCFSPTPENLDLYYIIVRDFTLILNKFSLAKILSASPNNTSSLSAHEYLNHIKNNYQADFLLKMDVEELNQRLSLKCLLLHSATEEVVWGESFDIEDRRESRDFDAMYLRIANDLFAPDNGIAHQYHGRYIQGSSSSRENSDHQFALLYLNNSYMGFTKRELQVALLFCEHRLLSQPHDSVALFVNLHLCIQDFLSGYQATENLRERYLTLVKQALRIEPESSDTRLFHAFAAYLQEDYSLATDELEKALSINNYSAFSHFFVGSLYYLLGDYERGKLHVDKALSASQRHPDWYHVPDCLNAYRLGDYDTALELAKKIYIAWGSTLRALIYFKTNQLDAVRREAPEIYREAPFLPAQGDWVTASSYAKNSFLADLMTDLQGLMDFLAEEEETEAI